MSRDSSSHSYATVGSDTLLHMCRLVTATLSRWVENPRMNMPALHLPCAAGLLGGMFYASPCQGKLS